MVRDLPADDVKPIGVPDSPKVLAAADVFRTVATNLEAMRPIGEVQ